MATKVSESTGYGPNLEMSFFGYLLAAIMLIVMLPALPIIAVVYVLWRLFARDDEVETRFESWRESKNPPQPPSTA